MTAERIRSLADVRPGDGFFTNIGGIVPGLFPVKVGEMACRSYVRIGRRRFDHIGIVTDAGYGAAAEFFPELVSHPYAVQAMPKGAEEIELTPERYWREDVTFFRLPEDYPGQAEDAAAIARAMVGIPYSFLSYAYLALWIRGLKAERLARHIDRRQAQAVKLPRWSNGVEGHPRGGRLPQEAICSVLFDQAWTLAGKTILHGTRPQVVTPGMLRVALDAHDGVIWGGKGLL